MPLICYQKKNFDPATLQTINRANAILEEYARQGYDLTLRQLYYQYVSRGLIENKDTEYKRLGSIINDARLAGLIDWDHITDRTRNMKQNPHWRSPKEILRTAADQFQIEKWDSQPNYVEVWVEKDALVGVLEVACKPLDVPYFSCRGYTSQSEMWAASQRLLSAHRKGKRVHIIHLGDHDPSGKDMTRDIEDRITMFMQHHIAQEILRGMPRREGEDRKQWEDRVAAAAVRDRGYIEPMTIHRIALNMDQIEEYNPPPNPAKLTDARAKKYIEEFGGESWELDALEPAVITDLINQEVQSLRDDDLWNEAVEEEEEHQQQLAKCAANWDTLKETL